MRRSRGSLILSSTASERPGALWEGCAVPEAAGWGARWPLCHTGASQMLFAWRQAVNSSSAHPPTHLLDISQTSYF